MFDFHMLLGHGDGVNLGVEFVDLLHVRHDLRATPLPQQFFGNRACRHPANGFPSAGASAPCQLRMPYLAS